MEDIKVYGHIISGISPSTNAYQNGDNWVTEANNIYDKDFKNLSDDTTEGNLPIERLDLINRYLYLKEESLVSDLTDALSQETLERKNNDALISADISALNGRLQNEIYDIQNKLNNYKLYSVVASLPTSNIDKNKIYIIASEEGVENNIYTEYIYTDSNTWEKLGEFKADIDLSQYVTNDRVPKYIVSRGDEDKLPLSFVRDSEGVHLAVHRWDAEHGALMDAKLSNIIPLATNDSPGLISAYQSKKLNTIPFSIVRAIKTFITTTADTGSIDIDNINLNDNKDNWWSLTIPAATTETAGFMTASDKSRLDNVPNQILSRFNDVTTNGDKIDLNFTYFNLEGGKPYDFPVSIPAVTSSNPGIMSAEDKNKLDEAFELADKFSDIGKIGYVLPKFNFINNDDSITLEYSYAINNGDSWDNDTKELEIPSASSDNAGVMSIEDKEKLDSVVKDTEPIVFTLGELPLWGDPWSIIPTVGLSKTLTDEELQKSNLINLYKILDSNNPIVINIQGLNPKRYYIKEKFGDRDSFDKYGIVVLVEDKELEIKYLSMMVSNPNGGAIWTQSTVISSKYIHQHADDSSVNALEYCLIKKLDYDDILRRLSVLEAESGHIVEGH